MTAVAGRRKLGALGAGLLSGFLLFFALVLFLSYGADDPEFNVEIRLHGADLTRHGATAVTIADAYGWRRQQICREACDDLQVLIATAGDNSFEVAVQDGQGRQAAGPVGAYVTNGTGVTRWAVGGEQTLEIRLSSIDRGPGGILRERPWNRPQAQHAAASTP